MPSAATVNSLILVRSVGGHLKPQMSLIETEALWPIVLKIEAALREEDKLVKEEEQAVHELEWAVSAMITAIKQKRMVDTHPLSLALIRVEHALECRTTGVDGWPLRS